MGTSKFSILRRSSASLQAGRQLASEAAVEVDQDALADALDAGRAREEVLHAERQDLALGVLLDLLEGELVEHVDGEQPRRPPGEAGEAHHLV